MPDKKPSSNSATRTRARRGTDNIRARGGSWQARIVVNGEAFTESFKTKGDAQLWIDLKRGSALDGEYAAFYQARRMTLADAIQVYRKHRLVSVNCEKDDRQEQSRLRLLASLPESLSPLLDVTPAALDILFNNLQTHGMRSIHDRGPGDATVKVLDTNTKAGRTEKALSNNSIRLYMAALSSVYRHLTKGLKWHFLVDSMALVERPPAGPPRTRRLESNEEETLVAGLNEYGPAYVLTFLLLISTTCRIGELFALRWTDIDDGRQQVHVTKAKAGPRTSPLSAETELLLEELPRVGTHVIPITRNAFEMAWKRTTQRHGIKNLRIHDCRREGASRWGQRVRNIVDLMKITGHKTMSQAAIYLKGTVEDATAAMNSAFADDPYLKHRIKPAVRNHESVVRHLFTEAGEKTALTVSKTRLNHLSRNSFGEFDVFNAGNGIEDSI